MAEDPRYQPPITIRDRTLPQSPYPPTRQMADAPYQAPISYPPPPPSSWGSPRRPNRNAPRLTRIGSVLLSLVLAAIAILTYVHIFPNWSFLPHDAGISVLVNGPTPTPTPIPYPDLIGQWGGCLHTVNPNNFNEPWLVRIDPNRPPQLSGSLYTQVYDWGGVHFNENTADFQGHYLDTQQIEFSGDIIFPDIVGLSSYTSAVATMHGAIVSTGRLEGTYTVNGLASGIWFLERGADITTLTCT